MASRSELENYAVDALLTMASLAQEEDVDAHLELSPRSRQAAAAQQKTIAQPGSRQQSQQGRTSQSPPRCRTPVSEQRLAGLLQAPSASMLLHTTEEDGCPLCRSSTCADMQCAPSHSAVGLVVRPAPGISRPVDYGQLLLNGFVSPQGALAGPSGASRPSSPGLPPRCPSPFSPIVLSMRRDGEGPALDRPASFCSSSSPLTTPRNPLAPVSAPGKSLGAQGWLSPSRPTTSADCAEEFLTPRQRAEREVAREAEEAAAVAARAALMDRRAMQLPGLEDFAILGPLPGSTAKHRRPSVCTEAAHYRHARALDHKPQILVVDRAGRVAECEADLRQQSPGPSGRGKAKQGALPEGVTRYKSVGRPTGSRSAAHQAVFSCREDRFAKGRFSKTSMLGSVIHLSPALDDEGDPLYELDALAATPILPEVHEPNLIQWPSMHLERTLTRATSLACMDLAGTARDTKLLLAGLSEPRRRGHEQFMATMYRDLRDCTSPKPSPRRRASPPRNGVFRPQSVSPGAISAMGGLLVPPRSPGRKLEDQKIWI